MDLLLGNFADLHLVGMSDAELGELERWLAVPDQKIFAWINGMESVPADFDSPLFRRLRDLHITRKV
jgi:antitoxin CptB